MSIQQVDPPLGPAGRSFSGSQGPDTIIGTAGRDRIFGNGGNDILSGEGGGDLVFGGLGNDRLLGGASDDVLQGNAGADAMYGQAGNDTYVVDDFGDLVFEAADMGVDRVISFLSYTLPDHIEDLQLAGRRDLDGVGNRFDNVLSGNLGTLQIANRLTGGLGNDFLYGRDGNDTLIGGDGWDLLDGGTGIDLMAGGTGDDIYYVDSRFERVIERVGEGIDLVYSAGAEALQANVEDLILTGRANANGFGNSGDNTIRGNAGRNFLVGGDGDDILIGDNGSDRLFGGLGRDDLRGGAFPDVFEFRTVEDSVRFGLRDVIRDLEVGIDKIDVSLIDANVLDAGDQAFRFIGNAPFTMVEPGVDDTSRVGEIRLAREILYFDIDGDGVAEFEIRLNDAKPTQDDFIL